MSTAFVLGNGISRKEVSPTALQRFGKVYGCNALYREFAPDVLVATDKPIATKIQQDGYALANCFYTRYPEPKTGARAVPEHYRGFSSGPIAVGIAAIDQNFRIYLLGFDMGPTENNTFNNVYADTEFYKTSAHPPTFTGNWIKQIVQITKDYPKTQFIRICGPTTAKINELNALDNLEHWDMSSFLDCINNQKDF